MHQGIENNMMGAEINVLIGDYLSTDIDLFFNPVLPNDIFLNMPKDAMWSHLLVKIGVFPSMGQAKKNGWHKTIPSGYSDITVGKLKTRICILKIID